MGCFFTACFGNCKHKDRLKNGSQLQQNLSSSKEDAVKLLASDTESMKEEETANPIKLISESEASRIGTQMDCSNGKKAMFNNPNENLVEIENGELAENKIEKRKNDENDSEEANLDDNSKENCCYVQQESSESLFSLSIDSRKHVYALEIGEKEEVNSTPMKKPCDRENTLLGPEKIVGVTMDEKEKELFGPEKSVDVNSDLKVETLSGPGKVVDLNLKGPKKLVDFFVNPLENSPLKYQEDKENLNLEGKQNGPTSKGHAVKQSKPLSDCTKQITGKEIGADCTSLSSWLAESEKFSHKSTSVVNSPGSEKNYEDRRVLGAITLKKVNKCSSVGSTPTCSGDDQPGIGTVGRYWRQTGLNGPVMDTGLGSSCREMSTVLTNV